ncbi:MAG: hypothetical protein QXV21_02795 [Candidatus Bathyarchaeia archaeon]
MRKGILAIGIFLMFLGLIFTSISRSISEVDVNWVLVATSSAAGMGADRLSVQGNLTQGDYFFVNFTIRPPTETIPDVAGIEITITDPNNNKTNYEIEIGPGPRFLNPFPEGPVNVTGQYNVEAVARLINLTRLDLRKREVGEKKYPYEYLLPIGGVILGVGVVTSIIGLKTSKRKKRFSKLKAD